jgi:Tol biopolymer transport system component
LPAELSFDDNWTEDGPYFSTDGQRLYFYAKPTENQSASWDIYYVDRMNNGWSDPVELGPQVNTSTGKEVFHSVAADSTLYFFRLGPPRLMYRSNYSDGAYQEPELMHDVINQQLYYSHAYIAPDQSYLIFSAEREDSHGSADLYISFASEPGQWSDPQNLGPEINSSMADRSPSLSPDGQYLFFARHRIPAQGGACCGDFYWVRATFIVTLKPE